MNISDSFLHGLVLLQERSFDMRLGGNNFQGVLGLSSRKVEIFWDHGYVALGVLSTEILDNSSQFVELSSCQ